MTAQLESEPIVLDTNIVLDAWVFKDPATKPLLQALLDGRLQWLATAPMRDELERVLGYPQIAKRLAHNQMTAAQVMAQFDTQVKVMSVAPKAPVTCKDPDDQKFIDLAVAQRTLLLSKDGAVLSMAKRLAAHGVCARTAMNIIAIESCLGQLQ